jgi:acyl-CoA thioester hydrolase
MFPITVPIEVRFGDLDALGHVNNAIYLSYDEIGRMHYLRKVGAMIDSGHFVMARAEVDYLKPVVLNQRVELSLRVSKVGNKSFQTLSELRADGVLAARTVVVVVWLEGEKPQRIPDWMRSAIGELESEAVEGL